MKYLFISIISYIICVAQSFLSLKQFKNEPSSSCLNCSLLPEILRYSFLIILIPITFFLLKKTKIEIRNIILSLTLILISFFINLSVFKSRVTSWSTFTFQDELIGTLKLSYVYLIISFLLLFIYLKLSNKNKKHFINI